MSAASELLTIGTRGSALALWQTKYVAGLLQQCHADLHIDLQEIVTQGDKNRIEALPSIGGKGLFTAELEEGLRNKSIDIAVHSLKDLPTDMDPAFVVAAIPAREKISDVLVSRSGAAFRDLPTGALVGSSSLRRTAQLARLRSDLLFESIRGNIDTRIRKVCENGMYDAVVLAYAGIARLGLDSNVSYVFSLEEIVPAPGQGALAIQCRSDDARTRALLAPLESPEARATTTAERAFLAALGAGCSTPVGAYAVINGSNLNLRGRCLSEDGAKSVDVADSAPISDAAELGQRLAERVLKQGFKLTRVKE